MFYSVAMMINASKVRRETLEGVPYLVAPIVMFKSGVWSSSVNKSDKDDGEGDTFYTNELLKESVPDWDGRPITVYHPMLNNQYVSADEPELEGKRTIGFLKQTGFNEPELTTEGWFNEARTKEVDGRVYDALDKGEVMEVSPGMFGISDIADGLYNGKKYKRKPKKIIPDHLAILPDRKGACSTDCGCGLLRNEADANSSNKEPSMPTKNDKITLLINARVGWDEADRDTLTKMPDAKFDGIYAGYEPMLKKPAGHTILEQKPAPTPVPTAPVSYEAFINSAPPELQGVFRQLEADAKAAKSTLIANIRANPNNQFSEEWLLTQPLDALKGMAALGGVTQQHVQSNPVPILNQQMVGQGHGAQQPRLLLPPELAAQQTQQAQK